MKSKIILSLLVLILETCFSTGTNPCVKEKCNLINTECFNNVITFNHKQYQSNNFAINKKGEVIFELAEYYDYDDMFTSRLFYGLTKDGKYFFSNQSSYTYELNIDIDDELFDYYCYYNFYTVHNSLNLFVSIKNAPNKDNQYLFSINSYYSMIQLYKLNNESISYVIWNFYNFFNLDEDDYIFQYEYSLFELSRDSTYIITFIPKIKIYEELRNVSFIKKFRFKSFDKNAYEEINSTNYEQFINHTILSTFLMDDSGILGIVSYLEIEENDPESFDSSDNSIYLRFVINFFRNDLKALGNTKNIELFSKSFDQFRRDYGKIFYKSIYLKNQQFLSIYSKYEYEHYFVFKLSYINNYNQVSHPRADIYLTNKYPFNNEYGSLTDVAKIDNNRIVFFYTSKYSPRENWKLVIVIIDIPRDDNSLKITAYRFVLDNLEPNIQISGFSYNGFIVFASTFISEENNNYYDNSINYLSLFMVFGYPNGTDSIVNISYYLNDSENYIPENNFFEFLFSKMKIENNIFYYLPINSIKLISIPKEIIILESVKPNDNGGDDVVEEVVDENGNEDEEDSIQYNHLGNNSFLNGSYNHVLKQNKNLTKTSKYYFIDYQYMVEENEERRRRRLVGDLEPIPPKIYYGRINRLQFKLCNDYCETCYELGISENNQKCSTCLPKYQYDYWYYFNNTLENCVPEEYYYDIENNSLVLCNSVEYKFYYNKTNKKTICFKKEYECPLSYPLLNNITNECYNYPEPETTTNECHECQYNCYIHGDCKLDNNSSSEEIYDAIKTVYLPFYRGSDGPITLKDENNFTFELTTINNEMNSFKSGIKTGLSIINFEKCAEVLKSENNIEPDVDLVVVKYENEDSEKNGNDKSVQYEIYPPGSNEKLNLSACSNTNFDIYIPVQLDEETQKLYEDLKAQGYDLFDKNDKFYTDICTPYKSENGTDILLSDRYNDIFLKNQLSCQDNCEYSDYSPDSQYLKCECKIADEGIIESKSSEKLTGKSILNSFYNTLKYSNYKVLKCYKLVFRKVTISENIGSILTNLFIIGYLIALGIFCYKKMSYLLDEIEKLFNNNGKNNDINKDSFEKDDPSDLKKNKILNTENITNVIKLKGNSKRKNINKEENKEDKENIEDKVNKTGIKKYDAFEKSKMRMSMNFGKKKNNKIKAKKNFGEKVDDSINIVKINSIKNNLDREKSLKDNIISSNRFFVYEKEYNNIISKKFKINNSEIIEKREAKEVNEVLNDYELNDLEYLEAINLDNRNFFRIYWYLLKRENLILFTFFNWNDFNIFSIKLAKFFFSICSDMAFNVFFFSDDSMHDIYVSGGKYSFISQLAQMIYSTIISQILQIFINYLTVTDIAYYKIKELKKENNINKMKSLSIIKCIKYKIIIFYCFTFLLFLFFWYLISAFCAVYQNTQGIFITDSLTSFAMGLLYTFGLYLIPTGLRLISLKSKEKKNLKILYSLSDKIPFF